MFDFSDVIPQHENRSSWLIVVSALLATWMISVFVNYVTKRLRYIKRIDELPGPKLCSSHPWFADFYPFFKTIGSIPKHPNMHDTLTVFEDFARTFSNDGIFRMWLFHPYRCFPVARAGVVIFDADLTKQVLTERKHTQWLTKERRSFGRAKAIAGTSFLGLSDGPEWKRQRKMAAVGFHRGFVNHAYQITIDQLYQKVFPLWDLLIDESNKSSSSSASNGNRTSSNGSSTLNGGSGGKSVATIEMTGWCARLALEVLGHVAFSQAFGGLDDFDAKTSSFQPPSDKQEHELSLFEGYHNMITAINIRARTPEFLQNFQFKNNKVFRSGSKLLNSTIRRIVRDRLKEIDSDGATNPKREDLLSCLLVKDEDGNRMAYKYIFGNSRMFLFAGHDTTASPLAGVLWELANHPSVQTTLQEEIDQVFDAATGSQPPFKELNSLRYLDAVVKETLRLYAPAMIGRTTVHDITLTKPGGRTYVIPADTAVFLMPILTHKRNNVSCSDDPNAFVPERFLQKDVSNDAIVRSWIPFSVGPRNCVGQPLALTEIKAALAHIVRRYNILPNKNAIKPVLVATLTLKPHEVLVDLERRRF